MSCIRLTSRRTEFKPLINEGTDPTEKSFFKQDLANHRLWTILIPNMTIAAA